ncbi:MAG TPA: [Fe-Fe] hydrogenase large subunit C-terminal domain-containing protein [Syntrophorhabdaceae bacterium]|nr:[Fe-Fe] hydrogenase large subunit C-terminal domain-containing protein [Syntrophorhabdaceae bacterium]HOS04884.1 [Fe-Fe] hydrogenase large subunit C-terminal domain-containing protein [Syntrophorhabdaceae bacterium]HPL40290.1 [Fe-Fe] hydrogenase large subunit C-terminal domain-containing protein [Syntrophorhabdaceae bacterium]
MYNQFHAVRLDYDKCKGCTNCIKHCPMEAIRVHDGKAKITQERCIDCGECIRICQNHAKIALTDEINMLSAYKYCIALPAPSFFGQFKNNENVEDILNAFLDIGFDDVFEVALAAEVVASVAREYLKNYRGKKPLFSSACPASLRLMQIKFPELLGHVIPILTPMEVAARIAKEEAHKTTGLPLKDIGAFFITPCPAKVTEAKTPMITKQSAVDGVIGANIIYKDIVKYIAKGDSKRRHSLNKATGSGIGWGYITGESKSIGFGTSLAVSGIHNVISLLEEIELGELQDVDFIELQACTGGCVGGPLNIQNLFVGRVRLRHLIEKQTNKASHYSDSELLEFYKKGDFKSTESIKPRPIMMLDEDVSKALEKMERIDNITNGLPGLDCGACGSPSCRALAEDIVRGHAFETDCVIKLREKVKILAEEILDLARIIPPSMSDASSKKDK